MYIASKAYCDLTDPLPDLRYQGVKYIYTIYRYPLHYRSRSSPKISTVRHTPLSFTESSSTNAVAYVVPEIQGTIQEVAIAKCKRAAELVCSNLPSKFMHTQCMCVGWWTMHNRRHSSRLQSAQWSSRTLHQTFPHSART